MKWKYKNIRLWADSFKTFKTCLLNWARKQSLPQMQHRRLLHLTMCLVLTCHHNFDKINVEKERTLQFYHCLYGQWTFTGQKDWEWVKADVKSLAKVVKSLFITLFSALESTTEEKKSLLKANKNLFLFCYFLEGEKLEWKEKTESKINPSDVSWFIRFAFLSKTFL